MNKITEQAQDELLCANCGHVEIHHYRVIGGEDNGKYVCDICTCTNFNPLNTRPAPAKPDADVDGTMLERAARCLDYRLTGSEAVIAISVMQEFATAETAKLSAKLDAVREALTTIRNHYRMRHVECKYCGDAAAIAAKAILDNEAPGRAGHS